MVGVALVWGDLVVAGGQDGMDDPLESLVMMLWVWLAHC